MAEQIALDLIVKGEAAKTIGEIKQSIKDLKNEALKFEENSEGFVKFTQAAANAKKRLEDVNESINNLHPEKVGLAFARVGSGIANGFSAAQGAMALFGNSTEDLQKQLLKVQAATALAQGIQNVQDLGKSFQALFAIISANPFVAMATAVAAVGVAIYKFTRTVADNTTEWIKNNAVINEAKKSRDSLNSTLDETAIALQKEKGLLTDSDAKILSLIESQTKKRNELTKKGQEEFKKINEEFYDALKSARIDNDTDEIERLEGIISKRKKAVNDALTNEFKAFKLDNELKIQTAEQFEKNKTSIEKIENDKRANEQALNNAKRLKELKDNARKQQEEFDIENLIESQNQIDKTKIYEKGLMDRFELNNKILSESEAKTKEILEKELKTQKDIADAKMTIAQSTVDGLTALTDLVGKNGKRAERVQKGLALAQIAVDTAKSISSAIAGAQAAAAAGGPAAPFLAVAYTVSSIASVLANMAKAKKILGESGGGDSSPIQNISQQNTPIPNTNKINPTVTVLNPNNMDAGNGQLNPIKVYVTESDITSTQNQVNTIIQKATIQ